MPCNSCGSINQGKYLGACRREVRTEVQGIGFICLSTGMVSLLGYEPYSVSGSLTTLLWSAAAAFFVLLMISSEKRWSAFTSALSSQILKEFKQPQRTGSR
jgi:hypothetical protein